MHLRVFCPHGAQEKKEETAASSFKNGEKTPTKKVLLDLTTRRFASPAVLPENPPQSSHLNKIASPRSLAPTRS